MIVHVGIGMTIAVAYLIVVVSVDDIVMVVRMIIDVRRV
jgi:hypothetical protein